VKSRGSKKTKGAASLGVIAMEWGGGRTGKKTPKTGDEERRGFPAKGGKRKGTKKIRGGLCH